MCKDITDQVESAQRWRQEAVEDKLTGLYTRRYGEELTKNAALKARTLRTPLAIIRWGGEEFVILLDDCPRPPGLALAERIRRQVESLHDQEVGTVTLSLGLAMLEPDETVEQTIVRADAALYPSKNLGRNRVSVA